MTDLASCLLSHVKGELDELFEFLRAFDEATNRKHIIVALLTISIVVSAART